MKQEYSIPNTGRPSVCGPCVSYGPYTFAGFDGTYRADAASSQEESFLRSLSTATSSLPATTLHDELNCCAGLQSSRNVHPVTNPLLSNQLAQILSTTAFHPIHHARPDIHGAAADHLSSLQYVQQLIARRPTRDTASTLTARGRAEEVKNTILDPRATSSSISGSESTSESLSKRPRVEANPSAQTYKPQVRREKIGDRITALQQLVSPFGKTDTASVLLEAIGYIKFLQEQVQALMTPYMKTTRTTTTHADGGQKSESDSNEPNLDLRSKGLCLVPVSCTMHVTNENGADFWAPSLAGLAFR